MPHYRNGQPACIGDVVKGKGYNLKDENGELREFVGTVVGLTPGSASCNIQVAYIETREIHREHAENSYFFTRGAQISGCGPNGGNGDYVVGARVGLEYGQCDAFDLVLGVTVQCYCENKEVRLRPVVLGAELIAACKADSRYRLFRRMEHGGDDPLGVAEAISIKKGDQFYCIPPATGA